MKLSLLTFYITATLQLTAATEWCPFSLQLAKTTFSVGEDVVIQMNQCEDYAASDDFVAIYSADFPTHEIQGDANYLQWIWACGTQHCHAPAASNSLVFGKQHNEQTWPLKPGNYRAHLIKWVGDDGHKGLEEDSVFASVANSIVFTVTDDDTKFQSVQNKRRQLLQSGQQEQQQDMQPCIDAISTSSKCVDEGEEVSVLISHECTRLTEGSWIGFVQDDIVQGDEVMGEPALWTWVCQEPACWAESTSSKFHFHGMNGRLLAPGSYRAVYVPVGYREGGPYKTSMLSSPFVVTPKGQPCHVGQAIVNH